MQLSRWSKTASALTAAVFVTCFTPTWSNADVNPGDTVTKDNMDQAGELLIPAIKWYVQQGMPIKVVPYKKVPLPKLFKEATEKYSGQVKLSADGHEIFNYVAGLPFPSIDPNDPMVGFKIMWNQEQADRTIRSSG